MAQVFKISDDTNTVDLVAGTILWRFQGWQTRSATDLTWETIDLVSTSAGSAIRTEAAKLDELIDQARRYHADQNENNPVWLYFQSEGESAKRSLIYNGYVELLTENKWSPLLGGTNDPGASMRVALQRAPLWESTTAGTVTAGSINLMGGTVVIGNDTGTAPQRIKEFKITGNGTSGLAYIGELWAGIRKTRNGVAGFIPVWDCTLGTNNAGYDTTKQADAAAYGGSAMYCDWAPGGGGSFTDLYQRFFMYWSDVASANYDDIIGKYLLLVRTKFGDASTVVRMQARHGWGANDNYSTIVSDTYVDSSDDTNLNGNYRLKPLGYISVPPTGNRGGAASTSDIIKNYRIEMYAELVSGTAAVWWDSFILVPAEHMVTALNKNSVIAGVGPSYTYYFRAFTGEDDTQYAVTEANNFGFVSIEHSFENWYYPVGGGVLVVAGQKNTSQTDTTGDITLELYPRWQTYRDT